MNESNHSETPLRSWIPRRPSAKLKARLFPAAEADTWNPAPWSHWLAPATACLLLLFVTFSPRNNRLAGLTANSTNGLLATLSLSNQSYAPYQYARFNVDQNAVPAGKFEWINVSHPATSNGSVFLGRTNHLIQ